MAKSSYRNSSEAVNILPTALNILAGQDLSELEAKAAAAAKALKQEQQALTGKSADGLVEEAAELDDTAVVHTSDPETSVVDFEDNSKGDEDGDEEQGGTDEDDGDDDGHEDSDDEGANEQHPLPNGAGAGGMEENVVYLGLRVYTNKSSPAVVGGQLRHEMATSFAGLAIDGL